jgi:hypothetical protein
MLERLKEKLDTIRAKNPRTEKEAFTAGGTIPRRTRSGVYTISIMGKTINIDPDDVPYDMTIEEYGEKVITKMKEAGSVISTDGGTVLIKDGYVVAKPPYITVIDPYADDSLAGSRAHVVKTKGIRVINPKLKV